MNRDLGVLISGRGINLQAIIDADRRGRARRRRSPSSSRTVPDAARPRARAGGGHRDARASTTRRSPSREAYDAALVDGRSARASVDLVCLAGFMRLLGAPFLDAFPDRDPQHPPGAAAGVPRPRTRSARRSSTASRSPACTVHFVDDDLDAGPIVAAGRGARPRRRHRGHARRAHPRRGAPHLPGGHRARARRRLAGRRAAADLRLTASRWAPAQGRTRARRQCVPTLGPAHAGRQNGASGFCRRHAGPPSSPHVGSRPFCARFANRECGLVRGARASSHPPAPSPTRIPGPESRTRSPEPSGIVVTLERER